MLKISNERPSLRGHHDNLKRFHSVPCQDSRKIDQDTFKSDDVSPWGDLDSVTNDFKQLLEGEPDGLKASLNRCRDTRDSTRHQA